MAKTKTKSGLLAAGALFVVGLVLMLVVLLSPASKIGTYKYKGEEMGQEIEMTVKLGKDKATQEAYLNGEKNELGSSEFEYKVEDGKLCSKMAGLWVPMGEITSRKITVGEGEDAMEFKNGFASAALIVSIVLTAVGALGAVAVVLTKKK